MNQANLSQCGPGISAAKRVLSGMGVLRARRFVLRARLATSYYNERYRQIFRWLWSSNEDTNFTYSLKPENLLSLCQTVSVVTGRPLTEIEDYVAEVKDNSELKAHVLERTMASPERMVADNVAEFGRRLGWYAFVRALKPKVVVETGVDKGLGSLLLAYGILRNREEGHPGLYYGTDINPKAGYLLAGRYAEAGKILYGDSLASLRGLREKIDLFINDSDHSAEYEYQEYLAIRDKLSDRSIILGDNSHVTDRLSRFSKENGRKFLLFREQPLDHWYPGGGIGISF